ncbi:MAG: 2-dehydropantoate 2-reductase, partial [Rhodovibrionaceae bacterium]|nr:2-dehydropantoate 2-reductase [Rhodovibrionaceae bacterium]
MGNGGSRTKDHPRIIVYGAGAVGGYFGGRLAEAGYPVGFVARGRQLQALRGDGLRLISPFGELHLPDVTASQEAADLGPADVVLLCVKLWDVADAARRCADVLAKDGAIIPLQNGVEAESEVAAAVGQAHVAGGVAYIGSEVESPGVIRHVSDFARLVFGELDGRKSERLAAFLDACKTAGIEARVSDDIHRDIWEKFCFLAPFAGATALARAPIGGVRQDPTAWERFQTMVHEAAAVGRAMGVQLPEDFERKTIDFA